MPIDLFIDPTQPRRTSALLFEQLRTAIDDGRLQPGDRLPTSRELAHELGVARSTVTSVYGQLVGEGLLDARTGDGTFVADFEPNSRKPQRAKPTTLPPRPATVAGLGRPPEARIDLLTGRPDPRLFPLAAWRRCVIDALQSPPPGYGDRAGLPALRTALAVWIRRSRGVDATSGQVLVIGGAQHGFDLIARALLAPGETIAIENPGYALARQAFQHHGLKIAPIPVDCDGIMVERIPLNARAVYVTPSHQSPTGVTMSAARRRTLLAFADARDAIIIEDDYDTEFRHVDRPLEPIYRLDTNSRVVYVGTFSKTLTPSLRLGFLVAPEVIVDALADTRALIDTQPPHLTQAALAAFITTGEMDRHLRRSRREYTARHALVAERIARLHANRLAGPLARSNAGLHTMITLLDDSDANDIAERLAKRGIAIHTTGEWWATPSKLDLIVGFGAANTEQLNEAFDHLETELHRQRRPQRAASRLSSR
jgi:GntR family transcriptional regulator / MocR family aminotransferase